VAERLAPLVRRDAQVPAAVFGVSPLHATHSSRPGGLVVGCPLFRRPARSHHAPRSLRPSDSRSGHRNISELIGRGPAVGMCTAPAGREAFIGRRRRRGAGGRRAGAT
jgi:hypothetical protein